MVKCLPEIEYFTVFLKIRNIISKIRESKVIDYAAIPQCSLSPLAAHFIWFSANQLQEKDHIQRGIFPITHTFVRLIPIT